MANKGTQKLFSKEDVDRMVKQDGKAIVIFEGDVYDATDFKITHPGGPKYIEDHLGEDITELFYEEEHTKIALRLLKDLKIGSLTNKADEQISHKNDHNESRMKEVENEAWRQKIDPAHGTVYQVFTKLSHDEYVKFINDPKHLTKPGEMLRMFEYDFLEFFSRTPWYHIGLFWTPIVLFKLWQGLQEASVFEVALYFLLGVVHWTFLEYSLHRFIFHMELYMPDSRYLRTLHYIIHGVHHSFPMDKDRLVFPIILAVPIYYGLWYLFASIYPAIIINSLSAGVICAYMCYDMGHYYLHHSQPLQVVEYRKKYHMYHHYKDPDNGYGITTSIWDKVFGTELDMAKKQIGKELPK